MTIPAELVLEKNKLSNTSPWLILLDIQMPSVLRLTNDIDQVTFQSNTYFPFPMGINHAPQSISGEMPEITITVGNQNREMQALIEPLSGAIDTTVIMRVVHKANLSSDYTDFERRFIVVATSADDQWVHFNLGMKSPTQRRFPLFRTMGFHCNWLFKSIECGYTGATAECDHTLSTCQQLNGRYQRRKGTEYIWLGATRFGGFPGLQSQGVKFV